MKVLKKLKQIDPLRNPVILTGKRKSKAKSGTETKIVKKIVKKKILTKKARIFPKKKKPIVFHITPQNTDTPAQPLNDKIISTDTAETGERRKKRKNKGLSKTVKKQRSQLEENRKAKIKTAEEYLKSWRQEKSAPQTGDGNSSEKWKFNKSLQNWLLRNWSSEEHVEKETFELFIDYLSGVPEKSNARTTLIAECEETLNRTEPPVTEELERRARAIIQAL